MRSVDLRDESGASKRVARSCSLDDLGRERRPPPLRSRPWRNDSRTESSDVSDTQLIQVTDAATSALSAFDFTAHDGKGVRVFVQGFG